MAKCKILDSDGVEVKAGDKIRFGYGIPAVSVRRAPVVERDGKLLALTKGHNPSECQPSESM